jgi:molybdopterin molybdotransferase
MPEFLRLSAPDEALHILLRALPQRKPSVDEVDTASSLGRVTAENICAPHPLPEFSRSTVDGYAVQALDTFGVSESLPGYLTLVGEISMGEPAPFKLSSGSCALIHTGGMLPESADAVVMIEYTQVVNLAIECKDGKEKTCKPLEPAYTKEIEVTCPVAEGENTIRIGEDVERDQLVIEAGTRLRPVEIGGCMALGITKLRVATIPKIGIISTGNEIVPPDERPGLGQVRDVNSYSLAALVKEAGGKPELFGIVRDNLSALRSISEKALAECDALIITAGSSASTRDLTAEVITSLGLPGILIHGVNVRPGKPTILAVCNGKAVIGLPGNPVSALVIAGLFVKPVIDMLSGASPEQKALLQAMLMVNLPSQAGREDWVAVKVLNNPEWNVIDEKPKWLASPIFGKSNLIFSLAAADGLVRIPPDITGISAGENVEVFLL